MIPSHAILLDEFLAWQEARGARPQGIIGLRSRVPRFLQWLEDGGMTIADIDRRQVRAYQTHLLQSTTQHGIPYQTHTVLSYRQAASSFITWLVETKKVSSNPFKTLRGPRSPKTVVHDVLKESDMQRLLEWLSDWKQAGSNPQRQYRRYITHVMAEVQYATGLRIAEVAALQQDDIDLDRRLITVRDGKAGRTRYAYLSDYTAAILSIYLTEMRHIVLTQKQAHNPDLVFGAGRSALGHCQNDHLDEAGRALGLHITNHGFRHAVGYHLLRNGCPLRHIQEILGHKSIRDTEIYTKVDVPKVQDAVDAYHPRGHKTLGNNDRGSHRVT